MQNISRTVGKQSVIVALSGFIFLCAIAGLIMDASGVPWYSEAKDFNPDESKYENFESEDWEECCEDDYNSFLDSSSDEQNTLATFYLTISPLTTYFVLILIFSLCCMVTGAIPFDIRFKLPLVALFGLATTTSGIFLARKSSITISAYFIDLSNAGNIGVSTHLHVMIYYAAILAGICLLLGSVTISSIKSSLRYNDRESFGLLKRAQLFLSLSLIVFILSPIVPIAYVSADKDYENYDEEEGIEGQYVFPTSLLIINDYLSSTGAEDDFEDEIDIAKSTAGNYALAEDMFFVLIWVNLSVILLASMALIPHAGKILVGLAQLNIASIVLILISLIFSIIMYVNLPDLLGENGFFNETRYDSFYFHVNWLAIICCLAGIVNWIFLLTKSHIPWWRNTIANSKKVPISNFEQFGNVGAQSQYYGGNQIGNNNQGFDALNGQQPPRF